MPTILGANSVSGFNISNSVRFNQGDHCLTQNFSGTESSNRKKWTFSVWFKRSNLIGSAALFTAGSSGQDEMTIRLEAHKIDWQEYKVSNSTMIGQLITNQVLRDVSAWYHLVCRWDSTDSTAGDRMKMFLNGVEITSFATDNNPTEDYDSMASNSVLHNVGRQSWNNQGDFDGYMAEINFAEGVSLDPSYFGETNDNGVWVPKKPDVSSYGNNGFFLEFQQTGTSQNSSGIGADTSGNDKHFAVSNLAATDVTTDTPTNNFATLRPHGFPQDSRSVLSEGNTDFDFTGDGNLGGRVLSAHAISNIGVTTGKWYAEFKLTEDADGGFVGVSNMSNKIQTANISSYNYLYTDNGNKYVREHTGEDESNAAHGAAVSVNDIVQVALDATNRNVYFGKGGSWASGSGAWDQSGPTSAVAYTADFVTTDSHDVVVFNVASAGSSEAPRWQANFGNPPFAISSGNADGAGHGNFEYAVPSGYFALNTKNLAKYG